MKALYSFHPHADEQLDEIWLYSYRTWGEQQADKYIDELYELLERVAEDLSHPNIKSIPDDRCGGVKYVKYQQHCIFFREARYHLEENIQILTILHARMDIPTRLQEALNKL